MGFAQKNRSRTPTIEPETIIAAPLACATPGKTSYERQEDVPERGRTGVRLFSYYCTPCRAWHATKRKLNL